MRLSNVPGGKRELSISDSAVNFSVLNLGGSGSGKTVALKSIEKKIVQDGGRVLILNYDGTHNDVLGDTVNYYTIKVKDEGIPVPFLEGFFNSSGEAEGDEDICEGVIDVFNQIYKMGYRQQNIFAESCERALMTREKYEDDMECLYNAVLSLEGNEKDALLAKYRKIFRKVKFHKHFNLWKDGKATVLDFSGYSHSTQLALSQLILSVLWRYYRIFGQQMETGTWIVLDEFQNFPLQKDSLLAQILREGRKYKLSLLLATQTLSSFDMPARAILQQPGTKLYFRPVKDDVKRIAKCLPDIEAADAEEILRNLKVKECLANGEFKVAGGAKQRSLKLSFREDDYKG